MNTNSYRSPLGAIRFFPLIFLLAVPLTADGGATPEAAWDLTREAYAAQDWEAMVSMVAPSERAFFAWNMDFGIRMMVEMSEGSEAEKWKAALAAARRKYSVPSGDVIPEPDFDFEITASTTEEQVNAHLRKLAAAQFGEVDILGYFLALIEIFRATGESMETAFPAGELGQVEIADDRAEASLGEEGSVVFLREGGRWYPSVDSMRQ